MSTEDDVEDVSSAMREGMAEMQAVTEDLRRESALMNAEVDAERAALRAERAHALDDYAELARGGGAGEAREVLQGRMDRDETTGATSCRPSTRTGAPRTCAPRSSATRAPRSTRSNATSPTSAATYRQHAVLRESDRIGEWTDDPQQ
ncbi:hypothetical protein [Nocardioides sp. B-3]|uniref:hypothetical protein n=1 Tax=Nocardioides sp. B-3 TaxID=2895565 RepID=UPI00215339BD|nr:hypothetical protein [Nocardioides sp. B-3]UUZ58786.1 hypothetical protein LP418_22270 [Nocardioides sp. B-3]